MAKKITKVVLEITARGYSKKIFSGDKELFTEDYEMLSPGKAKGKQNYEDIEDFYDKYDDLGEAIKDLDGFNVACQMLQGDA